MSTDIHISAAQGARELVQELSMQLQELALSLQQQAEQVRIDALYAIPLRHKVEVEADAPIRIESLAGRPEQALPLCIEVLSSLWLRAEQSARETIRAPGAIALPNSILERINATNKARMTLYNLIRPLTQAERTEIWRSFPGLCSLQALRVTPLLKAPYSLRFYWDTGASMERRQVSELIALYQTQLQKSGFGTRPPLAALPEGSGDRKFVFALERLEQLPPDEQVALYRPVTPHIRARVRDEDDPGYICSAPVPFVYPLEAEPPRIKPLQDFDPHPRSGSRSIRAQVMEEPYVEALNIYRYLEGHRRHGPVQPLGRTRNKRKNIA